MNLDFNTVFENLDYVGEADWVEGTKDSIARTILQLPEDIAEKALYDVTYFDMGEKYGLYHQWSPPADAKNSLCHFIFLNLEWVADQSEKEFTIAHEIAHFTLGHGRATDINRNIEKEADSLVEKWGFKIPERRKRSM